jgi:hypothetical protein
MLTLRSPSQLQTERVSPAQRCTLASCVEFLDGIEQPEDSCDFLIAGN